MPTIKGSLTVPTQTGVGPATGIVHVTPYPRRQLTADESSRLPAPTMTRLVDGEFSVYMEETDAFWCYVVYEETQVPRTRYVSVRDTLTTNYHDLEEVDPRTFDPLVPIPPSAQEILNKARAVTKLAHKTINEAGEVLPAARKEIRQLTDIAIRSAIEREGAINDAVMTEVADDDTSSFHASLSSTIATETEPIARSAGADAAVDVLASQPEVTDAAATRAVTVAADPAVAALLADDDSATTGRLDTAIRTRTRFSLAAGPATGVSVFTDAARPVVIRSFGGYLWGHLNGRIWRSVNGTAWEDFSSGPDGSPPAIIHPTDDGEVLAATFGGIFRSAGWQTGSVTWERKVTAHGGSHYQPYSLAGSGQKFICADYGLRADSRYARISVDGGHTWTVVYDALQRYTQSQYDITHIHGVEYDPWSDRFYLAEGHGDVAGIYVSSDNGATWVRPPGLIISPAPTTLTATDDGLVCGSDSARAGLFGIVRQDDPMTEDFTETWRWRPGVPGVLGFGVSGHRDPDTGVVYVAFRSALPDVAPVIAGGTAGAAGLVYAWPTTPVNLTDDIKHAVVTKGRLYAHGLVNGENYHIIGHVAAPGIPMPEPDVRVEGDSMAVGPMSTTTTSTGDPAIRSTATGVGSDAGNNAVAIGYNAAAGNQAVAIGDSVSSGSSSVAIGQGASNGTNGHSHAIGTGATVTGGQGVAFGSNTSAALISAAIGHNAKTNAAYGVAIGPASTADGGQTAVGHAASATTGGDAFGKDATSAHYRGLALGRATSTTAAYQAHIGQRALAAQALDASPAAPPAGHGTLFFRVVDGKMGLYVRFPTGDTLGPIAVEP